MCIIVSKEKGVKLPTKKILENCFNRNSDGAGFMYVKNNQVMIDKGYMTFEDFYKRLKELKKDYPLFIVSNCESGYIENFLNGCNTKDYFIDHTCVGDTGLEKWQNILFLKDKYSIEEVIYVGDTNKDFVEATKANVKFVHAHYGFQKDVPCAYKIDSLKELARLLKMIFN